MGAVAQAALTKIVAPPSAATAAAPAPTTPVAPALAAMTAMDAMDLPAAPAAMDVPAAMDAPAAPTAGAPRWPLVPTAEVIAVLEENRHRAVSEYSEVREALDRIAGLAGFEFMVKNNRREREKQEPALAAGGSGVCTGRVRKAPPVMSCARFCRGAPFRERKVAERTAAKRAV